MPTVLKESMPLLLVGESNPYGADPYYALYPAPERSSGYRLCVDILGMSRVHYLRHFRRVNLVAGDWKIAEARIRAAILRAESGYGILLGAKVSSAFGLPYDPFEVHGGYLVLPHPSGLNRMWNEDGAFTKARDAVVDYAPFLSGLVGAHRPEDLEW